MTGFPSGSAVWGAGYRADGLRAWTRKTAAGAKTYSYYDGGNAVLETKADGTIVGMNIFAPDGLVTRWSKLSGTIPVVGDYQFDWQGNAVHCLFSGARYADEPLIHSAYNAWGQRNFVYSNGASSASDLLRFGYNARWGYKLDTETGLYYCQHRYYDPQNGRWVTRDPAGYGGGINVYGYCRARSVLSTDPEGLQAASAQTSAALAGAMAEVGSAEAAAADASYEVAAGIINDINAAGSASGGCTSPILSGAGKAIASGAAIIAPAVINDPVVNSPTQGTGGCPPCDPTPLLRLINGTQESFDYHQENIKSADWEDVGIITEFDCDRWYDSMVLKIGSGWSGYQYALLMQAIAAKRDQCYDWVKRNRMPPWMRPQ